MKPNTLGSVVSNWPIYLILRLRLQNYYMATAATSPYHPHPAPPGSLPPRYQMAEVINLQAMRDEARRKR
ncbi:MAG: hypothetical protein KDI79_22510 [Anaerolineae bacterium]|nr:hypothetical protein [Anaerolineae bacterium]